MLLAIDIGNTNIVVGGYKDDELLFLSRMRTDHLKTKDEYAVILRSVTKLHGYLREDLTGAIISSVVPALVSTIRDALLMINKDARVLTVGPGMKTGLNIKLDDPATLGSDLVCVSVASLAKYKQPSIVIDMGTATTISAIDRNNAYLGGSIIPGIRTSMEALALNTALLQHISFDTAPKSVIGSNTIDAMLSGAIFGNASQLDGMIARYKEELGDDLTVIATGGAAPLIIKHCVQDIVYDENLLLDGLNILYKKNTL
ncbi:MAG: type III pantothenate kinase [Oscillospiraceae bacterium]|nr:type III pantothenate kinase [Oscillospiraceae bacterium]